MVLGSFGIFHGPLGVSMKTSGYFCIHHCYLYFEAVVVLVNERKLVHLIAKSSSSKESTPEKKIEVSFCSVMSIIVC